MAHCLPMGQTGGTIIKKQTLQTVLHSEIDFNRMETSWLVGVGKSSETSGLGQDALVREEQNQIPQCWKRLGVHGMTSAGARSTVSGWKLRRVGAEGERTRTLLQRGSCHQ